jgi:DNA-binding SARP family transcriptional activator
MRASAQRRRRPIAHDSLIETLWPEMTYAAARRNLNTMLRCCLGAERKLPQPPLIVHAGGHQALGKHVILSFDTGRFERGLRRAAAASTIARDLPRDEEESTMSFFRFMANLRRHSRRWSMPMKSARRTVAT